MIVYTSDRPHDDGSIGDSMSRMSVNSNNAVPINGASSVAIPDLANSDPAQNLLFDTGFDVSGQSLIEGKILTLAVYNDSAGTLDSPPARMLGYWNIVYSPA